MRLLNNTAYIAAATFASLLFTASAFADPPEKFLTKAIQGNMAEVKMGQLAQKNGASDGVKSFGKMLEADHGKARDQTLALAKSLKIAAPTEPAADAKTAYDKMAKLTGADFDKEFAHHMVMDHKKDIAEYEEESKEKGDPQVLKYVSETLPTLKKHLQTAETLGK